MLKINAPASFMICKGCGCKVDDLYTMADGVQAVLMAVGCTRCGQVRHIPQELIICMAGKEGKHDMDTKDQQAGGVQSN